MTLLSKSAESTPQIKTPQELVHIKHKITLRQYKYWILALRAYREAYEQGRAPDEAGFHRLSIADLKASLGYEPVRAELRTDLEAIRKEAIIYNVLGKDGKTVQRGAGFISEWEVSANWVGFKLPGFLAECVERLDLKNAIFQSLNWAIFNSFSGKYEAILYKLCKDYVGVRRTPYLDMEKFREYMGLGSGEYSEFKDLNKFVISGPIKKINESEIADITVSVEFRKESRRVVGLQFFVAMRRQSALDFGVDPTFAAAKIVISPVQQAKYLAERSSSEIVMAIERANAYAAEKEAKGETVNLGAIYQTAITAGWGKEYQAKLQRDEEVRTKKSATAAMTARPQTPEPDPVSLAKKADALAEFDALPPEGQDVRWNEFIAATPGADKAYAGKKRTGALARKALAVWLTKQR